jgi:predicted MFS family arabinose efflux permease
MFSISQFSQRTEMKEGNTSLVGYSLLVGGVAGFTGGFLASFFVNTFGFGQEAQTLAVLIHVCCMLYMMYFVSIVSFVCPCGPFCVRARLCMRAGVVCAVYVCSCA